MNAVQKYDKVQFNLPIAESLLYHPCLAPTRLSSGVLEEIMYVRSGWVRSEYSM